MIEIQVQKRCKGCHCELPDFEPEDYCQLYDLLRVLGWHWFTEEAPSALECVSDPDRLCHKIGDLVAHRGMAPRRVRLRGRE